MTERECRRAERRDRERWSVDVTYRGECQKRWADLVSVDDDRRRAIELEFAVKHTARLEAILDGYRYQRTFQEVLWLVESPPLVRRLRRMIDRFPRDSWLGNALPGVDMRVVPYTPGQEGPVEALIAGWEVETTIASWST